MTSSIMSQFVNENKFDFESFLGDSDRLDCTTTTMGSLQGCQALYYPSLGISGGAENFEPSFQYSSIDLWDLSSLSAIQQPSNQEAIQVAPAIWSNGDSNIIGSISNSTVDCFTDDFSAQEAWSPSSTGTNSSEQTIKQPSPEASDASSCVNDSSFGRSRKQTKKPKIDKAVRLEKRREKNRTSQRKFRERKEKYIQELEEQCRDLQARHDALLRSIAGSNIDAANRLQSWD
ncbi:hypothetical protein G7Y89_g4188 [Cudoniella acicularis]|uniref:BZIP domain-containing protein n=1 Tax=Cudoniella acicularis TaxID=354080 RepID=A0A8H4W6Y4_9HELO|nr:hypothetical protein G7Y89_g4188 [Cudoniella acicularis]